MKTVAVVGSSNTDMVVRLDRIPKPGETLLGGEFSTFAGGKGANQAVAAKRAGCNLFFLARLGNDALGDTVYANMEREGIELTGLIRDTKNPSGVALITVSKAGQNSIAVAPGANMALSVNDIKKFTKQIAEASVLLLQLETPLNTVVEAAKIASKAGTKVILNPAPAQKLPELIYRYIDFLTPNEHEAEVISGVKINTVKDAERAAAKIIKMGVKTVVITLGARGLYCVGAFGSCYQPAFHVKAVDTTAAGDTFNGAFAVALAENMDLTIALRFGSAAAALAVQKRGAQESIPNRSKIEGMLKKLT